MVLKLREGVEKEFKSINEIRKEQIEQRDIHIEKNYDILEKYIDIFKRIKKFEDELENKEKVIEDSDSDDSDVEKVNENNEFDWRTICNKLDIR